MAAGNQQLGFAIRAINEASKQLKEVQGDLDAMGKAAGDADPKIDKAGKATRDLGDAAEKTHGPLGKMAGAFGDVAKIAGGFVIGEGIMRLPGFLMDAAKGAAEDEAATHRLQQTFQNYANMAGAAPDTFQKLNDLLNERIDVGQKLAFTDTEVRDSLNFLLAATDDSTDAVKRQQAAFDLSRGAGIDLTLATRMLGKMTDENVNTFKKLGIELPKTATEADALAAVQARFGGQADSYAKSTAGQFKQAQIAMDEVKESIGYALIPVLSKFGQVLADNLPAIQAFVGELSEKFQAKVVPVMEIVMQKLTELGPKVTALGEWFQQDVQPKIEAFVAWIKPKLEEFGQKIQEKFGDFQAYYESDLKPALENIRKGFEEVVQWVKDHWDEISKIVGPVIDEVKNAVETGFNIIRGIFKIVIDLINGDWSKAWNDLKGLALDVMQGLLTSAQNILSPFQGVFSAIVDAASGAGEWIGHYLNVAGGYFMDFFNMAVSPIQWVIDKINALIDKIRSIPSPGDFLPGIPGFASGTPSAPGGLALVGEEGPELVALPRGARVYNNRETQSMIGQPAGATVNISVNGPVYAGQDGGAVFFGDMGHAMVSRLRAMGAA